jgi:hypothetical protein
VGKVTRREDIPLDFAKDDVDLIHLTGVRGQPIQADLKGQFQRLQLHPELFGRVGGAVIENQRNNLDACTQGVLKKVDQECFEVDELFSQAGPGKGKQNERAVAGGYHDRTGDC